MSLHSTGKGWGGADSSTETQPEPSLCTHRGGCGEGGLDLTQVPTGSLRARAILIRPALVRALIVLALTLSLSCLSLDLSVKGPLAGGGGGGG